MSWTLRIFAQAHFVLLICFGLYLTAVVLFFTAFGIGTSPLSALSAMNGHGSQSASESLAITFLVLSYILGMGAPAIGLCSYLAIFVGLIENQITFIRVCGSYTLCFLLSFWSVACAAQIYFQRVTGSSSGSNSSIGLNVASIVLGIVALAATVVYLMRFVAPLPTPVTEVMMATISSANDDDMHVQLETLPDVHIQVGDEKQEQLDF